MGRGGQARSGQRSWAASAVVPLAGATGRGDVARGCRSASSVAVRCAQRQRWRRDARLVRPLRRRAARRRSPVARRAAPCRRSDGRGRVADLVEEGQRAGLALQGVAHEAAHRALHLPLDGGRQAQRGQGLDVQPAVGPQHLQGVLREADHLGRRAWMAFAQHATRARAPSGTSRPPRAPGHTRRIAPPPGARRGHPPARTRTSARRAPAPCRHRGAGRRGAARRTRDRRWPAPRSLARPSRPGTRRWRPTRGGRAGSARPRSRWPA